MKAEACRHRRHRERGGVLLVVVLMMAVAMAMSVSLIGRATALAAELHARRSVLCARYGALGGLALGTAPGDPVAAAALVGPAVDSLVVRMVRLGPAWCVLRASATCQRAVRTLDRTMDDPAACDAAPG